MTATQATTHTPDAHRVSIVVPVYQGEHSLTQLVEDAVALNRPQLSPDKHRWRVTEVLLVHDCGPDASDRVIRALEAEHQIVRAIWLSKNYGQHAATLAGIASSGSEWIATIDEDGQHAPSDIAILLDAAMRAQATLVYARPSNRPPHGVARNMASRLSKRLMAAASGIRNAAEFQSFRLLLGEIGRSVAAYAGSDVYLDVALRWVTSRSTTALVEFRASASRPSGYSTRKLIGHFWRLVLSAGTRPLRVVSAMGVVFAVVGIVLAIIFVVQRLGDGNLPVGWASTTTILLLGTGAILFAVGVIAEYLGAAVNMAMGRPPYLIVSDPADGPLSRPPTST